MKNISLRLIGCRNRQGWTQTELANKIGVSMRTIQNWEANIGEPRGDSIRKLSEVFNVPISYWHDVSDVDDKIIKPNATAPVPTEKILPHRVPVVSWAKAGCGGNFHDLANQIDEWLDTDCKDPNSYALIIDGDSMEPQFFTGDRVVFLPNSQAQNGDIVVARLKETGDVFFKLFHQTGRNLEVVRLTSYNPAYPPLEHLMHEFRFIHPMYCLVRKRRRL